MTEYELEKEETESETEDEEEEKEILEKEKSTSWMDGSFWGMSPTNATSAAATVVMI
jgi:hypothetical protein